MTVSLKAKGLTCQRREEEGGGVGEWGEERGERVIAPPPDDCWYSNDNILFLLQDLKKVLSFLPYPGNYLHPVVYACTAVMLLCLLVSMVTYMVHHRSVNGSVLVTSVAV